MNWIKSLFLVVFIVSSVILNAAENVTDISFYKRVEVTDNSIHLIADLKKKTITIDKLVIDDELPIGDIKLKFPKPYIVKITRAEISKNGKITITGSDFFEGVGTDITLIFYTSHKNATVKIESQFEELSLYYVPQLLKIKIN